MTTKPRTRDKEKSKRDLIAAVGQILRTEGYTALGVNRIAAVAKVNKRLIYEYFDGIDGLIKAYLEQVDFWLQEKRKAAGKPSSKGLSQAQVLAILKKDYEYMRTSLEMQRIIQWGISEKNTELRNIADKREEYGKELFQLADQTFENSSVDFRALNAIFVSAIYYMVLHSSTNNSTICEIDVSKKKGRDRIFQTMDQLLGWSYAAARKKTRKNG